MQFELNLFRVTNGDDFSDTITHTITHIAGCVPGKPHTPENLKWYPVGKDQLICDDGTGGGILDNARRAMRMFMTYKWAVPELNGATLAFGNLRQMFNPYGSGAGGCVAAGVVQDFIQSALEFPRVEEYIGEENFGVRIGGVEYFDAYAPGIGQAKGTRETHAGGETTHVDDIDDITDKWEYSTGGFHTQCMAFKRYVDWVGANAGCPRAAQGVILAFDKLVDALGECGIDRISELLKVHAGIESALEEMCRALADAETAVGAPNPSIPSNTVSITKERFAKLETAVAGITVKIDAAGRDARTAADNTATVPELLPKIKTGIDGLYDTTAEPEPLNETARGAILKLWDAFRKGDFDGRDSRTGKTIKHKRTTQSFIDWYGNMEAYKKADGTIMTVNDCLPYGEDQLKKLLHTRSQTRYAAK